MNSRVEFRIDKEYEMLQILVDGKIFGEGNCWDFDFVRDSQRLLNVCGIQVDIESYHSEDCEGL